MSLDFDVKCFLSIISHQLMFKSLEADSYWHNLYIFTLLNQLLTSLSLSLQRFHLIPYWRILALSCWVKKQSSAVMSLMSSGLISWGFSGFWETKRWRKSRSVSPVFYKTCLLVSITGLTRIIRCWPAAQTYCKKAETCGGPRGPASICRSTVSVCFYVFSAALIFSRSSFIKLLI